MPLTLRNRNGRLPGPKWVDPNFDIKQDLRNANGGDMPDTPAFTTSELEGTNQWNDENPPAILFHLQPPKSKFQDQKMGHIISNEKKVSKNSFNKDRAIRDIPVLPDRISVDVPGWMIVAWRRIDPRIKLQDIVDRMTTDLGEAQEWTDKRVVIPSKNVLQNHCARNCRKLLNYFTDDGNRDLPSRTAVEAIASLTTNNIRYNTILKYHSKFHRLIKVKFVRNRGGGRTTIEQMNVGEDNLNETTYPVDYFLFPGCEVNLSKAMEASWTLLMVLQERAIKHKIHPLYWRNLERTCLPTSWYDRTRAKTQSPNTREGGCDVCTWKWAEDDDWTAFDLNKFPPHTSRLEKSRIESEAMELVRGTINDTTQKDVLDGTVDHRRANTPDAEHLVHLEPASTSPSIQGNTDLQDLGTKRKASGPKSSPPKRRATRCNNPNLNEEQSGPASSGDRGSGVSDEQQSSQDVYNTEDAGYLASNASTNHSIEAIPYMSSPELSYLQNQERSTESPEIDLPSLCGIGACHGGEHFSHNPYTLPEPITSHNYEASNVLDDPIFSSEVMGYDYVDPDMFEMFGTAASGVG